jgi:hypothetical protein
MVTSCLYSLLFYSPVFDWLTTFHVYDRSVLDMSHIHEMWLANQILVSKITVSKDRMLPC